MTAAPFATLFRSSALRAAFADRAADTLDAFLVPVGVASRKALAAAMESRRPHPVLVGGAAPSVNSNSLEVSHDQQ